MTVDGGYVKLYRKTLDSRVFENEGLLKVWIWCLLRASHKGRWISVKTGKGEQEIWIGPGQFLFGRHSASRELRMNPETTRKRMTKLKNMGNLTIQSTRHYSLISVVNWEVYQNDFRESTSQSTNEGPQTSMKRMKKMFLKKA